MLRQRFSSPMNHQMQSCRSGNCLSCRPKWAEKRGQLADSSRFKSGFSFCSSLYIYIHIYVHIDVHIYNHTHTYTHIHIYIYNNIYIYVYIHIYIYIYYYAKQFLLGSVGHSGCVSYRTLLSGLTWVDRSKDVQDHSTRAERVRVCHVFSNLKVTWIHLDTIDTIDMSSDTSFFRVTANYKQLGQRGSLVDQSQHSVRKPMSFSFQEHKKPRSFQARNFSCRYGDGSAA